MDVNYSIAHRPFFSIDGSKNLTSSDQKEKRRSNNRIYRLVSEKRKIRKNVGPLGKEMGTFPRSPGTFIPGMSGIPLM